MVHGLCHRTTAASHGVDFMVIISFVMGMETRSRHAIHGRVVRPLVMEGRVERVRSVK